MVIRNPDLNTCEASPDGLDGTKVAKSVDSEKVMARLKEPPDVASASFTPEVEMSDMKQSALESPLGPTDLYVNTAENFSHPRSSVRTSAYDTYLSWLLGKGCSDGEAKMWIENLMPPEVVLQDSKHDL